MGAVHAGASGRPAGRRCASRPARSPAGPPAAGRAEHAARPNGADRRVAAAALVLVGAGAFAVGRASLDDHRSGFQVDQAGTATARAPSPGRLAPFPGATTARATTTVTPPGDHDEDRRDHDDARSRSALPQHRVSGTRARLDSTIRLVAGRRCGSAALVTYWGSRRRHHGPATTVGAPPPWAG